MNTIEKPVEDNITLLAAMWGEYKKYIPQVSRDGEKKSLFTDNCLTECLVDLQEDADFDMRSFRMVALLLEERLMDPACTKEKLLLDAAEMSRFASMFMYAEGDYNEDDMSEDRRCALKMVRQNAVNTYAVDFEKDEK